MTTYETVQSWLRGSAFSFFAPLDAAGRAVAREGVDTVVFLFVDPGPVEGDDPLFLYMPLLSLTGADEAAQLAFFWSLCQRNAPGSLPTGYRLCADEEEQAIYLAGQFSPAGMDAPGFDALARAFTRFGRVCGTQLAEELQALGTTPPAAALSGRAASNPSVPSASADPFDLAARRSAPLRA
jgi:hypothetical protein